MGDREEGSASEPANGEPGDGAERGARTATIEAGDFWASGGTQEFVGVASAAHGSAPPRVQRSADLRQRLVRPQFLVAVAAAVLVAGAGVAAWWVSSPPQRAAKTFADLSVRPGHGRPAVTYASTSTRIEPGYHRRYLHRCEARVNSELQGKHIANTTAPRRSPQHKPVRSTVAMIEKEQSHGLSGRSRDSTPR